MRTLFLIFLLLLLGHSELLGQIVNIEDRRLDYDSSGWFGQLDLGGNYTRNSNEVLSINGGIRLDRVAKNDDQWLFIIDYRVVRANGNNFLNAGFSHFRYGKPINDWIQWETFSQVQYDQKIQLSLRWLLGSGPRIKLVEGEEGAVFFGLLYMYEYDELSNIALTFRDHRLSSYLSLAWKVSPNFSVNNITYYQPRLTQFNQTRLSSSTNLVVGLTKKLKFTTRFNMTYDARINDVFPEVPELTFNWVNGLRLGF
jgi:hypothetical protein